MVEPLPDDVTGGRSPIGWANTKISEVPGDTISVQNPAAAGFRWKGVACPQQRLGQFEWSAQHPFSLLLGASIVYTTG